MADYYDASGVARPVEDIAALATRRELTHVEGKLVFIMVGLPARGKSFIARKLQAFLSWLGFRCKTFNAGQSRRKEGQKLDRNLSEYTINQLDHGRAEFFNTANLEATKKREEIAMATLDELLMWLGDHGDIAIFDATNSNVARRSAVLRSVEGRTSSGTAGGPIRAVFVESICDNEEVLEANLLTKVRNSPDFRGIHEEAALADMRKRAAYYERTYQTVSDEEGTYIKVYNLSNKITANGVFGRMARSVIPYMMAIHIAHRPIFLVALPPQGDEFVCTERRDVAGETQGMSGVIQRLAAWARTLQSTSVGTPDNVGGQLRVFSSTKALKAANLVAATVGTRPKHLSGLNPLDRGCSTVNADSDNSKLEFNQRYEGGGESYADLVGRLEPCLLHLEAAMEPVLVIAHVFPCRVLRAYFLGLEVAKTLHEPASEGARALANANECVLELEPQMGGTYRERIHDLVAPPIADTGIAAADPKRRRVGEAMLAKCGNP